MLCSRSSRGMFCYIVDHPGGRSARGKVHYMTPPWILHRLSLLSFPFCSIKATRPKICKKSVCFYCITTSLWKTPVNYFCKTMPSNCTYIFP